MIKNNEMDLHYLLINEMLINSITKSLKLIKHAKFIKIFRLKRKEEIKVKRIN